jgi:hypothetical protein
MVSSRTREVGGEGPVRRAHAFPRSRTARLKRRAVWPGLAFALILSALALASGAAQGHQTVSSRNSTSRATAHALVFGIYPGGAAGTVGPGGPLKPENPARRLGALEQLRPHRRPFVLHLYAGYTGAGGYSAEQQVGEEIAAYGRAGFETELALAYRPDDGGSSADVARFVEFVRASVRSLADEPGFVSVQVTNEANEAGAPNASDGYYTGAEDALIRGVIAARQVVRGDHPRRIKVGFNWAYQTGDAQRAFWTYLGRAGGRRFVDAVDWVGLDAYPGTWGPELGAGGLAAATGRFMDTAFSRLRSTYLPLAGIPESVPLVVTENGYPTGPGRTEAMQVAAMRAAVTAVYRARRKYNITGYRWFDLRDADSATPTVESQYGLMRDDYSPKAAFRVYRDLVAEYDGR